MRNLHVVGAASELPLPSNLVARLCNADEHPPYRHCYVIVPEPAHPVTLHIVHGHYEASLYRPTHRERLRGWWYVHRWPLLRGLVLTLSVLAVVVALNLLLAGANDLADWISGVWR